MDIDIDLRLAWLFMRELAAQSRLALGAFDDLVHPGDQGPSADPWTDPGAYFRQSEHLNECAFRLVHSFLTHAGNVSKILWPPNPRSGHPISRESRDERAVGLRRVLGVPEDSALATRTFRDHLEHFDERLETWWLTEDGQNLDLIDMNRQPFGWSTLNGLTSASAGLRLLTGQPLKFRFLGSETNLEVMADALERVHEGAMSWLNTAAAAGIKRAEGAVRRIPLETYMQVPDSEAEANRRFDKAYMRLRELGILADWTGEALNELGTAVTDRGWTWSVAESTNNANEPHEARNTKTAEFESFIVRSRSVEEALAIALASLLEEEMMQNRRPSVLRVADSGSWTLVSKAG